ncbi:MAG: prephenate dehydratase [Gammaproteobacteria bacterium]|nr:MAG: prephenate dehydratase [Gammaproteobacteria bacterium]
MNKEELKKIRERIDELDTAIQSLINERASCAQEVARIKNEAGDSATFYRPGREADILRSIKERNQGPLSNEEMARLFREIMSACLALEQPLSIAYLGPEGTFTQSAALKHFGHSVTTVSMSSIDEVFREVESGAANYGVVPVENSTEGMITHTLDSFVNSSLKICGEVELRIHHHLLSRADNLADIRTVVSHSQSLAQCREWLDANLSSCERLAVSSNAEAARMIKEDRTRAAIAGETAAEIYGLDILAKNIEDEPDNTTRFLVIGKQIVSATGVDKTSLLVSADNTSGALSRLLQPLADNSVSMTRIESRPSRQGMWEYIFFIDLEGHVDDENVSNALKQLKQGAALLKVLGSYPRAVL